MNLRMKDDDNEEYVVNDETDEQYLVHKIGTLDDSRRRFWKHSCLPTRAV